jgi:hypothetical protein
VNACYRVVVVVVVAGSPGGGAGGCCMDGEKTRMKGKMRIKREKKGERI